MGKKIDGDRTAAQRAVYLYTKLLFSGQMLWLPDLAKELNCSKGTIMRAIEAIERSETVEIATDIEKGRRWYQIKSLPGRPHINLTLEEVEKLALCRDLLERLLPEGVEKVISEGIAKISALLEKSEKRAEATVVKANRISWGRVEGVDFQESLELLLKAITEKRACQVVYRDVIHRFPDRDRKPATYYFLPVRLTTEDETLNVEGWNLNGKGSKETKYPITIALHRVVSCTATNTLFEDIPKLPERVGAFGLVGFEAFPAVVRFTEDYADYIRERVWSRDQRIVELDDGEIELHFMAADENDLMCWVLGFGSAAELLEPEYLREHMYVEGKAITEYYKAG